MLVSLYNYVVTLRTWSTDVVLSFKSSNLSMANSCTNEVFKINTRHGATSQATPIPMHAPPPFFYQIGWNSSGFFYCVGQRADVEEGVRLSITSCEAGTEEL